MKATFRFFKFLFRPAVRRTRVGTKEPGDFPDMPFSGNQEQDTFADSDPLAGPSRKMLLFIVGTNLLVLVSVIVLTWALVRQEERHQRLVLKTELTTLSRALEEHVSRTFGEADNALREIGKNFASPTNRQHTTIQALHAEISEALARNPEISAIAAYSATGSELVSLRQRSFPSSFPPPLPHQISPHPQFSVSQESKILIWEPVRDDAGESFVPIESLIRDGQGSLLGSLSALINLKDFSRFHEGTRLTGDDVMGIFLPDGTELARRPDSSPSDWRHPAPKPAVSPAALQQMASGTLGIFNLERQGNHLYGISRPLDAQPLTVVAARPVTQANLALGQMKNRLIGAAITFCFILAVLSWLVYYDFRRRETSRIALHRLNASLEDRVSRRTAELEQSNQELIAFSYSISHDLRAPLRAINGFAHALREDFGHALDPQGKDYIDRIYRASVRMGELIDELLNLANVSRAPLSFKEINLTGIANEVIEELRLSHPEREVFFDAAPNLIAEGDEALLRNVLTNLLGNAWKFTRSRRPARISLSAAEDGEQVCFTVSDNGVGFDMAHAKRLFQPFQQLHTNQGYGGTGIGLASVHRIIERHGGTIWADSAPDQGAQFTFTLPLRAKVIRRRRNQVLKPPSRAKPATTGKKTPTRGRSPK